jgi:hypothetical protein
MSKAQFEIQKLVDDKEFNVRFRYSHNVTDVAEYMLKIALDDIHWLTAEIKDFKKFRQYKFKIPDELRDKIYQLHVKHFLAKDMQNEN